MNDAFGAVLADVYEQNRPIGDQVQPWERYGPAIAMINSELQ